MTRFGYTLMTEQSGPKQLVDYAISAERAGFDFEVCSDHYSPWLSSQGHAPNAWTVLGQIPICWDPDRDAAVARAHEQFRWFAGGWAVNADLPTTAGFAAATHFVRPEDTASAIPCGPDLDAIVEAVGKYWEAGFTDIALVQVGDDGQESFLKEAAEPLLQNLRSSAP